MFISPNYTTEQWIRLDFTKEEDWQTAVDIFEDRYRNWFINPVNLIESEYKYPGFTVIAIDCLLIETLQQFYEGLIKSSNSEVVFKHFFTKSSFKKWFDNDKAVKFYRLFRCGLLHQGEIKKDSLIRIVKNDLVEYTTSKEGLIVNRKLFHQQLIKEFENYLMNLRDSKSMELRINFKTKMDHICRISKGYIE